MANWTNRGKKLALDVYFRAATAPANFFVVLCTSADTPTADTNSLSDLTEIAAGNGYTAGGYSVSRNNTDFDTLAEDDANDRAAIQLKDIVWTASGGAIPSSGSGARWAVLIDDSDNVIAFWDLTTDRSVSDTQTFTLPNLELRLTE